MSILHKLKFSLSQKKIVIIKLYEKKNVKKFEIINYFLSSIKKALRGLPYENRKKLLQKYEMSL